VKVLPKQTGAILYEALAPDPERAVGANRERMCAAKIDVGHSREGGHLRRLLAFLLPARFKRMTR